MIPQTSSKEEMDDFKKRQELQSKLQEAIRRSASASEMRKIEEQIEELNKRLDSYSVRVKKP
jgi:uncharacterized protein YeeX (DUF496 family)